MKKILLFAFATICFMACQPDVTIEKKDHRMLHKASKDIDSLMGQDQEKAEKAILKAGFTKLSAEADPLCLPARYKKIAKRKMQAPQAGSIDYAEYVYVPEGVTVTSDYEYQQAVIDAINAKKVFVFMWVCYQDGKMRSLEAQVAMPDDQAETVKLYRGYSNNLYSSVPKKATDLEWEGEIYNDTYDSAFDNHASFAAELMHIEQGEVDEYCYYTSDAGSVAYEIGLIVPTEEDIADLASEGLPPMAYGYITASWVAPRKAMDSDRYKNGVEPQIDSEKGTVNGIKYDNTKEQCWEITTSMYILGMDVSSVSYVWGTEFIVVANVEYTLYTCAQTGFGGNCSYKVSTINDQESCEDANYQTE